MPEENQGATTAQTVQTVADAIPASATPKTDDEALSAILGESTEPVQDAAPEAKDEPKEEAKPESKAAPKDEDVRRAYAALLYDGVPKARIEKILAEDPAELVDWGLRAAQRQADVSRKLQERAEAAKGEQPKETAKPKPAFDYEAHLKDIEEDLSGSARKSFRAIVGRLQELEGQLQDRSNAATVAQQSVLSIRLETERERLKAEFPQVVDEPAWRDVLDEAAALAQLPKYQGKPLGEVLQRAAKAQFYDVDRATRQAQQAKTNAMRSAGQPTRPTGAGSTQHNRKPTVAELEDRYLSEMFAGKKPEPVTA